MTILIKDGDIDPKVQDLILDKQLEFKKKKRCTFSLVKTIEKLLKDAYLKNPEVKKIN